jgi:hypothetical protein
MSGRRAEIVERALRESEVASSNRGLSEGERERGGERERVRERGVSLVQGGVGVGVQSLGVPPTLPHLSEAE